VRGIVAGSLLVCGTLFLVNGPGPLLSGNMALTLGTGSLVAGFYLAVRWLIGARTG
jgi:hypothetical protein